jgi:ketosteroid isomerase-like protein
MTNRVKNWWPVLCLTALGIAFAAEVVPPSAIEAEVRRLDAEEANAVLRSDYARLDELWAEDFVVNNPINTVGMARTSRLRMGGITYSSFVRVPEFVSVRGDIVIIMGHEIVVPRPPSPAAGQTQNRRFSNFWMKTAQGWRLSARHANLAADLKASAP